VSAQNRVRLYWFNFGARSLDLFGNDNGSLIPQPKDTKVYLKDVLEIGVSGFELTKAGIDRANSKRGTDSIVVREATKKGVIKGGAIRERRLDESGNRKDSIVVYNTPKVIGDADLNGHDCIKRVYSPHGKSPTLTAVQGGNQEAKTSTNGVTWRKLTPTECERLQGMPDNYTDCVSNSQRYKMIGNGWNIATIAYIFNHLL
jgi:site-specific DNA-cytosine methylase